MATHHPLAIKKGEYDPRDALLRRGSPEYTFKGTAPHAPRVPTPGVGAYAPSDVLLHPTAPAAAASFRHPPPKSDERRPGPGDYAPASYAAKAPLPVTLKFRHAPPASQRPESGHAVPGPGEYRLPSTLGGPRFSIAARVVGGQR